MTACTSDATETESGLSLDLDNLATTTTAGTEPVDEVKWNLPYEPMSLDPMFGFNYAENTVTANLCESLVRMKPDLSTEPGLATDVAQPDDTTLVYTIRDGVTFWNGNPLTAEDVAWSLYRVMKLNFGLATTWKAYGYSVDNIQGLIRATDPHTLVVELPQPADPLLLIDSLAISPSAVIVLSLIHI